MEISFGLKSWISGFDNGGGGNKNIPNLNPKEKNWEGKLFPQVIFWGGF